MICLILSFITMFEFDFYDVLFPNRAVFGPFFLDFTKIKQKFGFTKLFGKNFVF